jgi:hypothetical protein
MFRQHAPAKRFNLTERHSFHPGPFQTKRESADARKQIEDAHHLTSHRGGKSHSRSFSITSSRDRHKAHRAPALIKSARCFI